MSSYQGVTVAHAALRQAALVGQGIPLRLLLDIVITVGGVSKASAYQALRAAISGRGQYSAERHVGRWPEPITITGTALSEQVWRLTYTHADRLARWRQEVDQFDALRAARQATRPHESAPPGLVQTASGSS